MTISVLIDGATGYVGTHLVSKLTESKFKVKSLVRPAAPEKDVAFLRSCGSDIYKADLANQSLIDRAMADVKVAVHLIGSIAPRKGESLEQLHKDQTDALMQQCKRNGVSKIIMVTALGAAKNATNSYHATKWRAEESLRSSGLSYVILRPSLLIGRQVGTRDSKLIKRLINLISTKNMIPLVGGGINKVQPLYIGDLVSVIEKIIQFDLFTDRSFELGGPDVLTMKQLVEELMNVVDKQKKIIDLPPQLALIIARICELIQNVPVISRDQVKLSQMDNICANNSIDTVFGVKPISVLSALKTYKTGVNAAQLSAVL